MAEYIVSVIGVCFMLYYIWWKYRNGALSRYKAAFGLDAFATRLLDQRINGFLKFIGARDGLIQRTSNGQLNLILNIYNRYEQVDDDKTKREAIERACCMYARKAIEDVLLEYKEKFDYIVFRYFYKAGEKLEVTISIQNQQVNLLPQPDAICL